MSIPIDLNETEDLRLIIAYIILILLVALGSIILFRNVLSLFKERKFRAEIRKNIKEKYGGIDDYG